VRIACLLWCELPETRDAQDTLWSVLARHLRRQGVRDVPGHLTRTRGLPVPAIFSDSRLLIGQCCGYDVVYGFASCVKVVATPRYAAPGCEGASYCSFVLVRHDCKADSLDGLRGSVCAINSFNSHSGTNALRALVAPLAHNGRFFSEVKVSGAHMNSLALLHAGEAQVMAMDCVLYALLNQHRPSALEGIRVICWSEPVPAPPIITSAATEHDVITKFSEVLAAALSDKDAHAAKATMLLDGFEFLPLEAYSRIIDIEGAALRHGYGELHATTPALLRRSD
jgi:ABC-type phosphate/phosphonate transport system substrate-binding protein